jgi:hypothetical protein
MQLDLFTPDICLNCNYFEDNPICTYGKCIKQWPGNTDKFVYKGATYCPIERKIKNNKLVKLVIHGKIKLSEMYDQWDKTI